MNGIQDGVAVVTGGGSGIGRQSSLRFAEAGAKVVVADVDEDGGHETVEMIESDGGEATFARTDVTDSDDVAAMVQTALDEYGGLDFAHNNAGIAEEGVRLADYDEAEWDRMLDVNLKGVWRCLKSEIPEMVERGGGAIVNTSSVAGVSANGSAHYAASKHGVIGLTRRATVDYAEDGIRVNAICPGVIDTPMVQQAGEDNTEEMDRITAGIPAGRLGNPREIANTVEGVIELLSHRDDRAAWIVSTLVVGDSDDEPQTQREEDLRSCMDAASGADVPEAAVFDRVIGSFNTTPPVVRLV